MRAFLNSSICWNLTGSHELSLFVEAQKRNNEAFQDKIGAKKFLGRPKKIDYVGLEADWIAYQKVCEGKDIRPNVDAFCELKAIKRRTFFNAKKTWIKNDNAPAECKKVMDWGDDE